MVIRVDRVGHRTILRRRRLCGSFGLTAAALLHRENHVWHLHRAAHQEQKALM